MNTGDEEFEAALELLNPTTFDRLLYRAANEPVQVAIDCQSALMTLEAVYEKPLNQLIAVAYAVACRLRESPEQLAQFIKHDLWRGSIRKPPKGEKLLRYVFRFFKRAWNRGSAYDTACRYTVALRYYFNKGTGPAKIPAVIKQIGGIEALYNTELRIGRGEKSHENSRRQPHRNTLVPKAFLKQTPLDPVPDYLPAVIDKEEKILALFNRFHDEVVDYVRRQHQDEEDGWMAAIDEERQRLAALRGTSK